MTDIFKNNSTVLARYTANLNILTDKEPPGYNLNSNWFYRHLVLLIMADVDPKSFDIACKKAIKFYREFC